MGFYGNITNTSRTQFQFDRVYTSRKQMDDSASEDGIYAGRYVLVNYEEDGASDYYLHAYKITTENGFQFGSSWNGEQLTRFRWVERVTQADPNNDVLFQYQVIAIPPDHIHNVADPNQTEWEFWRVEGHADVEVASETPGGEPTIVQYATFVEYADVYSLNYNIDVTEYSTSRGYDSTVWQKVYQDGQDKYVMVAELNTIVPTFDIEADAPKMIPLTPHFDADSTNVYYKLHWSPSWGFRVRNANASLLGPILNADGKNSGIGNTRMTSGTKTYPSDERTSWYKTTYDGVNTIKNFQFTVDEENQLGRWVSAEEGDYEGFDTILNEQGEYIYETVVEPEAAIYYNKAGFNPEKVSYGYFEIDLTADTYEPYIYYTKHNGVYSLADDLDFDSHETYYEKIEDHIKVEPTGISGHMYNRHDGTITDSVQEDIQELSIMLPALGNTIAAIWDLIYGSEEVNDGEMRNLDIRWEKARAGLDRHGLRLVNDYDFGGQYLYKTKSVETIAGALNSVHDLMGMIITSGTNEDLMNHIDDLSDHRIYYDETNHTFNRRHMIYNYTALPASSYGYEKVTVTAAGYKPGYYYIKNGNTYSIDTRSSWTSGAEYYLRTINESAEYTQVSGFSRFDGMTYCYPDFTGSDDSLYQYEAANVTASSYANNTFYIESGSNFVLDTSGEYVTGRNYFRKTSAFNPLKLDYVREPKYQRDKTYYRWDQIRTETFSNLSDIYEKNKFYYRDGQGNYILSESDTAETDKTYYSLKPENLRTLPSLFSAGSYFGIYVPGKYIYKDTNGNFKLAVETTLNRSLQNEQPVGGIYYVLDTSSQTTIDDNVYNRVITYQRANLIEDSMNYYIKDTYYLLKPGAHEGSNSDNDYYLCTDLEYDAAKAPYFVRNETLYKINNNYYQVDQERPYTLIQFHEYEFFHKKGNNYEVISRLADTALLTSDEIVVLRKNVSDNYGDYVLHAGDGDFNNPEISAMLYQDKFYEAGKFHYLTDSQLQNGYTDYILDTYPKKMHDVYYKIIEVRGAPVNLKFFESYRYYEKNTATGQYTLITDDNYDLTKPIYDRNALYVMNDTANIYPKGAVWNYDAHYIPATLTLGRRTESFGLEPFTDFARDLGTLHGLMIKIKGMLEYDDEDTRDTRTVQGALHTLQDKIAQFSTWSPGQVMVVDNYGRLHGADRVTTKWTKINVDPQVGTPSINIEHLWTQIADTSHTTNLKENNNASLVNIYPLVDETGHVGGKHTETYQLPQAFGVVTGDSGSLAAGGTHASIKFEGTDEWIQTAVDSTNRKVKFTHEYNPIDNTSGTTNLNTNNSAQYVDVSALIDATGHVVGTHSETIKFPHGFGVFKDDSNNSLVAGGTYATVKFEGSDNWIQTNVATEDSVKKVKITHEYHAGTSTTASINLSTNTGAQITDKEPILDDKGHVVAWKTTTIDMPDGYGVISGDSGTALAAGTPYATINFNGADSWIATEVATVDGTKTVKITHTGPVETNATARGETGNKTPNFGSTFKVPSFSIDSKGHIAVSADHTVKIPSLGLESGNETLVTSNKGNVVTGLTYTAGTNSGTFTKTESAVKDLVLTGYTTPSGVTQNIVASDSIGQAFGKLESAIESLDLSEVSAGNGYVIGKVSQTNGKVTASTKQLKAVDIPDISGNTVNYTYNNTSKTTTSATMAGAIDTINSTISGLDVDTPTLSNGQVIGSVSQTNGKITVGTKTLGVNDIPDIKSKQFSYTPTGESTAVTFTLQNLDERLRAIEATLA